MISDIWNIINLITDKKKFYHFKLTLLSFLTLSNIREANSNANSVRGPVSMEKEGTVLWHSALLKQTWAGLQHLLVSG